MMITMPASEIPTTTRWRTKASGRMASFLLAYTFSKSIDQASSISDPVDPYNFRATRAISAWDIPKIWWPAMC